MAQKTPDTRQHGGVWYEALRFTTLGWELALPIFGGVMAGYYVDRWLGTKPTFTLGLLVLGLGAGAYNIWRFVQRVDTQHKPDSAGSEDNGPP